MSIQNIILTFFIIGNSILGLLIFRNNPKSWTNRLFTFLIVLLTIYLTVNTQLYLFTDKAEKLFFSRFIIALGALINYAVFMFLITFPKRKITLSKKLLHPITSITIMLFLAGFTNLIFADVIVENSIVEPVPGLLMPIFLIHTIGLVFGGIIVSMIRLKKSRGIEKTKIRFVLVSFFLLFSTIISLNFILTVFFKYGNFVPLLPIYVFIFNLIIAYTIVKHKLLDIKPIVSRAVIYILLLLLLVTMYTILVFGLIKFLPSWVNRDYVFIIMAVIVAFSFNLIKNFLEKITLKILFRGHYNTEQLLSILIKIMATELEIEPLGRKLLITLTKNLNLTRGAFILVDKNKIKNIENFNFKEGLLKNEKLLSLLEGSPTNYIFEELTNKSIKSLFIKLRISAVFPLKVKNISIGLLVLGFKSSGEIYNKQDLKILEIFAPQAAIALQNAESYREIKQFSHILKKKVQERTEELKKTQDRELAKAKQLLKIKDEFVFIATHDLGTPITAIKGFTYLLEQEENKLSKTAKENLSALKEAGDRLSILTNDLLQVARSESGVIKIETKKIDIINLIKSIVKEVRPHATKQNIKISVNLHDKKCFVMADEKKLAEVMENLLSNSVKYNKDKGTISITTQTLKGKIKVDISDTGIGIAKKDYKKVFQKFSRLNQLGTEDITGTGLGLFVVRMLIEKMKGKISFHSEENKGTTFSFMLPLSSDQPSNSSLKKIVN